MAVTFYGNGLVYIPMRGRYIRFVDGEYKSTDEAEIAVLEKKYHFLKDNGEIEVTIPEEVDTDDIPSEVKPKRGRRPKNGQ